jgi:ABC-2 type transport system ATP-binding protein
MAAIELEGLSKQFGTVSALENVDLTIEQGEVFGFLGPNGAGKSTTINILLDFVRPTAGSAEVLGRDAQEDTLDVRQQTGVLPEGYTVYKRLSGRQHLEFVIESKDADNDPDKLAERVGIADAIDRKAGDYSKGMKQRLTLAMALVGDPDLLILDEPSTGLDPAGVREIREIIREESQRGTTVFFSSHILGQVEAVCDRVAILRGGELVAVDTVDGLRDTVGSGSRLLLTVPSITDDDIQSVREMGGVSSVTREGQQLTVSVEDDAKTAVINTLEDRGTSVEDFETIEDSLEDLFLAYTEGDR